MANLAAFAFPEVADLIDSIHDPIVVFDEGEVVRHINSAVRELLGWSPTDAVGVAVSRLLILPPTLERRGVLDARTKDARVMRVEGVLSPLTTSEGMMFAVTLRPL